jgi:hypothetical protein
MTIKITLPDNYVTLPFKLSVIEARLSEKQAGVYVFKDERGNALYVGKTSDFIRRFKEHYRTSRFVPLAKEVTVYFVDNPMEREIYETYAISLFKPIYNASKTYYKQHDNSEYSIRLEEINREIEALELEKADIEYEIESRKWEEHTALLFDFDFIDEEEDYFGDEYERVELGETLYQSKRLTEIDAALKKLRKEKSRISSIIAS